VLGAQFLEWPARPLPIATEGKKTGPPGENATHEDSAQLPSSGKSEPQERDSTRVCLSL
jgi:hypothetical protein